MDFNLKANPIHFPCIEVTWILNKIGLPIKHGEQKNLH